MRTRVGRLIAIYAFSGLAGCALWAPEPAFHGAVPSTAIDGSTTIAVVGDLQLTPAWIRSFRRREDNELEQRMLVADLTAHVASLGALVVVGDLVFTPRSNRDWTHFDSLVAPISARVPVLPAIGNHDYHCFPISLCNNKVIPRNVRRRFPWLAPGEPYALEYGDIGLAFLDSERDLDVQGAWLGEWIARGVGRLAAVIVFFHRPPYSNSIDLGARGDEEALRYVVPVVDGAELPAVVINGHIHGYEHLVVDGIHYFTTAGGGGPRGLLAAERPNDVYSGRDCRVNPDGTVLRPFNYLLVSRTSTGLDVEVRGFCKGESSIAVLESAHLPLP